MTSETTQLKRKVSALITSLDDLETSLEPLFDQSLSDSLSGLETIQQAKLNSVVPYLVYDLIFVYLKSRGIDPKTHPVVGELDRVRQYFTKISNAENALSRSTAIDKAAATRFIKHALSQVQAQPQAGGGPSNVLPASPEEGPVATKSLPTHTPVKVTSKMIEREQYQKLINDLESEEEEDLEVFNDEDEVRGLVNEETSSLPADANESRPLPSSGTKRERPRIDPFAGYGEDVIMDAPVEPSAKKARSGPRNDESSGRKGDRKAKKSKKKLSPR